MKGILVDEYGDLMISSCEVVIGDVDEQIVEFVMLAVPGEIKEIPTIGKNVYSMANGVVDPFFVGSLKIQLKTQHIEVKSVVVNLDEIAIEL